MDQVVQAINEKHPEFELKLDSFHSRGQPHAKFTVLHKESIDSALEEVTRDYEMRIKYLEGQRDELRGLLSMAVQPKTVIKQISNSVITVESEVSDSSQTAVERVDNLVQGPVTAEKIDTVNQHMEAKTGGKTE